MDNQDIRTLKILEEIENDRTPSQRDLAKKLNVSLGLINSFVRRLGQKGYFKITTIPKNRVRYILTPKGATEKTRLTYEYVQQSFHFYKHARRKLRDIFLQFEKQQIYKIIFFGIGELAEIAYISLQETKIKLVAIVDEKQTGEKTLGLKVIKPSEIKTLTYDRILITSSEPTDRLLKSLLDQGITRNRIILFL